MLERLLAIGVEVYHIVKHGLRHDLRPEYLEIIRPDYKLKTDAHADGPAQNV